MRRPIRARPAFKHRPEGLWAESGRLAKIAADILDETGAAVNALPFLLTALAIGPCAPQTGLSRKRFGGCVP